MKKSKLSNVVIKAESVEMAFSTLKNIVVKDFGRFTTPGYGVSPVYDQNNRVVVDYETLGDKSNCKTHTEELRFFGVPVSMPVAVSKYLEPGSNNQFVERETKTLNYDNTPENRRIVLETGLNASIVSLFYAKYMEIPLRGLSDDIRNYAPNYTAAPGQLPPVGKPFLDLWTGIPDTSLRTSQQYANLQILSGEQHVHMILHRCYLSTRVALYRMLLFVHDKKADKVGGLSSIVSDVSYVPHVSTNTFTVVDHTDVAKIVDPIAGRMDNTIDAVSAANIKMGPAKK